MRLDEALSLAFETHDKWREGKGSVTARINADHLLRVLGNDFDVNETNSATFAFVTTQLKAEDYAPSTINKITSVLSRLLTELRQTGHQAPDVKFKRQRIVETRPDFYKEDEIEALLAVATLQPDFMLLHDSIVFALKTGCRQGEMIKLTVDDVNIQRREICFVDTKDGTDHWLKMHDDLVPVLERRMDQLVDQRLFPWDNPDKLLREFKRIAKLAGIKPGRVWHTLRHTTATWMCERGVPLRSIMGVLNHSQMSTTLRYAKASDKAVAAAIDAM